MPKLPETEQLGKSSETVLLKAVAYDGLKQQEKAIKKEITERGDELREALKTSGVEDPNSGSFYINGVHLGRKVEIAHTCRKSTSFVPDAEEILKSELSKEDFDDLFETVVVLREDRLEQKIVEGVVSEELLSKITNVKEVFALTVKVK